MSKCSQLPLFRYTWAGKNESYCCVEHMIGIKSVADALGYYVQFIQITNSETIDLFNKGITCQNEVSDEKENQA